MEAYPIGTPGSPWGENEKAEWLKQQTVKRSYQEEVVSRLNGANAYFDCVQYGVLPYEDAAHPLYILKSKQWDTNKPVALVTGGVHGYETSGVQGAIEFALNHAKDYLDVFNLVVVPCISPWGYETINRWDQFAVDPNRSFYAESPAPESALIMAYLADEGLNPLVHLDLHETTDTDNSEFRPALAARDGTVHDNWNIPDGFYTVADTPNPQQDFQKAIIDAVAQVTHIAPPDENGQIIGAPLEQEGVICYDKKALFLCGGMTDAKYVTTTEVYPDSQSATPEICIDAQVAAIRGALDYVKSQLG